MLYAQHLRDLLLGDNLHFVIDASRNGVSPRDGLSQNNFALRLGEPPTTKVPCLDELALGFDALLRVTTPGMFEGYSKGCLDHAPPVGLFWVDAAMAFLGVAADCLN